MTNTHAGFSFLVYHAESLLTSLMGHFISSVFLKKKGDKKSHDNFRSVFMGNVVNLVSFKDLEFRLRDWLKNEEILSPVQAGFRLTFSIVVYIFTFEALRRKYARERKGWLFVAFFRPGECFHLSKKEAVN